MKTIFNKNLTKEEKNIPCLEIKDKRIYYKEIINSFNFVNLYKKEKSICEFLAKINTQTLRPFIRIPLKIRKSININEKDIVLIRICKEKQELEFVTQVYEWGLLRIPKNFVDILDIKNNEKVLIKIVGKNTALVSCNKGIDLAQIINYDKNVKIIPRQKDFIIIYYKKKIPITIPRFIESSSKLIELLFLIHGDGHYKSKLYFVNKNPELHKFVFDGFENIFNIPEELWRARILLFDLDKKDYSKRYWKDTLDLKNPQFYTTSKSALKTNSRGNLRIIIDKTILSLLFRFVFDKIINGLDEKNSFHALNGLLYAEGGAQLNKSGLHKITLSFNKQEKELFEKILRKASISKLAKEEQNKTFVIGGWNNLYSFFKILLSNNIIPFRVHSERRKKAFDGFLNHSFTKTMVKHLAVLNKNNNSTANELAKLLEIRRDSILDTLRKKQYGNFVKIEGKGVNKNPFIISITKEGKIFLKLVVQLEKLKIN